MHTEDYSFNDKASSNINDALKVMKTAVIILSEVKNQSVIIGDIVSFMHSLSLLLGGQNQELDNLHDHVSNSPNDFSQLVIYEILSHKSIIANKNYQNSIK
jgi:hypothetical protein